MNSGPYVGIIKCQDSLKQNNINLSGKNCGELIDNTRILLEVILWYLGHPAIDDVLQCLLHELVIKGVRMVKVEETLVGSHLLTLLQISVE